LLDRLSRHRLWRMIARDDLENLLAYATPRTLAPRARLFSTGDAGSALYVILSGWLKISREGPSGRDVVLEVAGAGSFTGELAVICGVPRAADATALTATRLLAIDGRALMTTLRQNPDAILELVRVLGERLARTTTQMEDTLFLPAEARLARALARLAALDPQPKGEQLTIDLGLSQRELGEMTGLSRESINKQLSLWRDTGLVGLAGRTLTLIDGAALSEIADAIDL
jgi:CRP/FNR family cyclic AMP-dependent transcriptional regulator